MLSAWRLFFLNSSSCSVIDSMIGLFLSRLSVPGYCSHKSSIKIDLQWNKAALSMVYPTRQFLFLVEKKSNMDAVGCFVHLEGNPCGWESVVLGARSHAMSSVRAHREEMQWHLLAFSFVHSRTLVCGMEWLLCLSLACSVNLSGNILTERGVSVSPGWLRMWTITANSLGDDSSSFVLLKG